MKENRRLTVEGEPAPLKVAGTAVPVAVCLRILVEFCALTVEDDACAGDVVKAPAVSVVISLKVVVCGWAVSVVRIDKVVFALAVSVLNEMWMLVVFVKC